MTELNDDHVCTQDESGLCNCDCHTTPTVEPTETGEVEKWEEKFDAEYTGMDNEQIWDGNRIKNFIRETITQALAEQKARMVEDLKKICNKSKTERGLAIALGNFIKALSK